jgi:hypothetical protein
MRDLRFLTDQILNCRLLPLLRRRLELSGLQRGPLSKPLQTIAVAVQRCQPPPVFRCQEQLIADLAYVGIQGA